MNAYLLGTIFVFASFGLFFILDRLGRPIVRVLLNGPFNRVYLQYLRSSTRFEFDAASLANNSDRAWSSVVFEKVYEIGIKGVPYSRRERNLDYIKAEIISKPQFNRKLADELIKVLPKQYGNDDFRTRLACFICELLSQRGDSNQSNTKPIHGVAIDYMTTAISAWVAGGVYLLLSLNVLDSYPPVLVALSNFLLFILMIVPLFNLMGTKLAKFTTVFTIATVIVLFLGIFASISHGSSRSPIEVDLSPFGNPNAKLTIRPPKWLTVNNTGCSGKKIVVSLRGQLDTPIRFHINDDNFSLLDKDCGEIIPQLEISQSETQAYEFYLAARDSSPFYTGTTEVRIIPSYISSSGEIDLDPSATFSVQLEHWVWGLVSNIYVASSSVGGTLLLFLINYILSKRNP